MNPPTGKFREPLLLAVVALSGAAGLVLELLGARLLAPAFGTTLPVWASLLSATLLGLGTGYVWGGVLADRGDRNRAFARILCAAGAAIWGAAALRGPVLALFSALGLYAGSLGAACVLLVPAQAFLGALGPIAVRLLARSSGEAGSSVGRAYAWSTLGGVAGALGTGFFLIPSLGARAILGFLGLALLAAGAAGLGVGRAEAASRSDAPAAERARKGTASPEPTRRYLRAAVFLAGVGTLALEVCASSAIGFFYGSSIYVWACVLSLTLVALGAGYRAGGRLADARPRLDVFAAVLALLAALTLLSLPLRAPLLQASVRFGVRWGALAAAAALFGPGLFLCGMLSPLCVRLYGEGLDGLGRRVGGLYALSCAGNIVGAMLAGFLLVPGMGVIPSLCALAALWCLLACAGLWIAGRRAAAGAVLAAGWAWSAAAWPAARPATNVRLVREGFYGQIKVVDSGGRRFLLVNGAIQSLVDMKTGRSVIEYCHALEAAPLWARPGSRALVIGLGAGSVPMMLARDYGLTVDVAEVDPAIARVARIAFAYSPSGDLFIQDGRRYIARTGRRYGLVVMDAFSGDSPPYHLYTREAFASLRGVLEPDGILAFNYVGMRKGSPPAWQAVYKTLRDAFPHVRAFSVQDESAMVPNILFFASSRPLDSLPDAAKMRPESRGDARGMFSRELHPAPEALSGAPFLTDDYVPLESLHAGAALLWRQGMLNAAQAVLAY